MNPREKFVAALEAYGVANFLDGKHGKGALSSEAKLAEVLRLFDEAARPVVEIKSDAVDAGPTPFQGRTTRRDV